MVSPSRISEVFFHPSNKATEYVLCTEPILQGPIPKSNGRQGGSRVKLSHLHNLDAYRRIGGQGPDLTQEDL